MVGESNYDQSYLMALKAWKTFGHSSEDPRLFARRMGKIGEAKGVPAAADAIAEDCRSHGLEMSQGRVMKSLTAALNRHRSDFPKYQSIEDLPIDEVGTLPPGVASLFVTPQNNTPQTQSKSSLKFILIAAAVALVAWLILK